jgi:hypothetical protein
VIRNIVTDTVVVIPLVYRNGYDDARNGLSQAIAILTFQNRARLLLLVSRSLVLRFVGWTRILRFETTDLLNLQFSQVSFLNLKNLLNYSALFSIFSSQHHKMFICANATRGLAQYRALKSRLHPLVILVEAYEVLKIGLILPANNKQQLNKGSS